MYVTCYIQLPTFWPRSVKLLTTKLIPTRSCSERSRARWRQAGLAHPAATTTKTTRLATDCMADGSVWCNNKHRSQLTGDQGTTLDVAPVEPQQCKQHVQSARKYRNGNRGTELTDRDEWYIHFMTTTERLVCLSFAFMFCSPISSIFTPALEPRIHPARQRGGKADIYEMKWFIAYSTYS